MKDKLLNNHYYHYFSILCYPIDVSYQIKVFT